MPVLTAIVERTLLLLLRNLRCYYDNVSRLLYDTNDMIKKGFQRRSWTRNRIPEQTGNCKNIGIKKGILTYISFLRCQSVPRDDRDECAHLSAGL
jgi:hypothetical protein